MFYMDNSWQPSEQVPVIKTARSSICEIWDTYKRNTYLLTTLLLHMFNGPLSSITQLGRYKGKTNLEFTEARDSEWQWHQLGHMQICTSLQTNNHSSTPPVSFLQAWCPSCCPTNSVKALKAYMWYLLYSICDILSQNYIYNFCTKFYSTFLKTLMVEEFPHQIWHLICHAHYTQTY